MKGRTKAFLFAIVFPIGVAMLFLGCASTTGNLQRETARSIGGSIAPEQVTVSNIQRGVTDVKWEASTPNGKYSCSSDDMVRRVYCVPVAAPKASAPTKTKLPRPAKGDSNARP